MSKNLYIDLSETTKKIFKNLIESYLETGEPVGSETLSKKSGLNLSASGIRSILANLQKEGLLFAPHISSGRVPTDKGMRLFVDGLLEFGRLTKDEREIIESQCKSKGTSYKEVLDEASKTISGLSNCAGLVLAPKFQNKIKHIEFIKINQKQTMSIIASENGLVENRILESEIIHDEKILKSVSNYLNSKYIGKTISEIKSLIRAEVKNKKTKLTKISEKLVQEGIIEFSKNNETPYIFLHGQSTLLEDDIVSKDLDKIRSLFDDIENKSSFIDILENTSKGRGVQIFIGSENFLFNHSGLSMIMAPYKNNEQKIIGAIGVVGPIRINYAKIVPLVDYTSKVIGRILS